MGAVHVQQRYIAHADPLGSSYRDGRLEARNLSAATETRCKVLRFVRTSTDKGLPLLSFIRHALLQLAGQLYNRLTPTVTVWLQLPRTRWLATYFCRTLHATSYLYELSIPFVGKDDHAPAYFLY